MPSRKDVRPLVPEPSCMADFSLQMIELGRSFSNALRSIHLPYFVPFSSRILRSTGIFFAYSDMASSKNGVCSVIPMDCDMERDGKCIISQILARSFSSSWPDSFLKKLYPAKSSSAPSPVMMDENPDSFADFIVRYTTILFLISIGLNTCKILITSCAAESRSSTGTVMTSSCRPHDLATSCACTRSGDWKSFATMPSATVFLFLIQDARIDESRPPDRAIESESHSSIDFDNSSLI